MGVLMSAGVMWNAVETEAGGVGGCDGCGRVAGVAVQAVMGWM